MLSISVLCPPSGSSSSSFWASPISIISLAGTTVSFCLLHSLTSSASSVWWIHEAKYVFSAVLSGLSFSYPRPLAPVDHRGGCLTSPLLTFCWIQQSPFLYFMLLVTLALPVQLWCELLAQILVSEEWRHWLDIAVNQSGPIWNTFTEPRNWTHMSQVGSILQANSNSPCAVALHFTTASLTTGSLKEGMSLDSRNSTTILDWTFWARIWVSLHNLFTYLLSNRAPKIWSLPVLSVPWRPLARLLRPRLVPR